MLHFETIFIFDWFIYFLNFRKKKKIVYEDNIFFLVCNSKREKMQLNKKNMLRKKEDFQKIDFNNYFFPLKKKEQFTFFPLKIMRLCFFELFF